MSRDTNEGHQRIYFFDYTFCARPMHKLRDLSRFFTQKNFTYPGEGIYAGEDGKRAAGQR